jgi:DTW domain-containing protein
LSDLPAAAPLHLQQDPAVPPESCPTCGKPPVLCVCEGVEPLETKVALLMLQHPQEQDRLLGTARLTQRSLKNSALKIGLSWPSLSKALGRDADPSQWAILHLGSTKPSDLPRDRELVVLDKKGVPLPDQDKELAGLRGIVLFDGSWAQAKTLWWRNAWVLKGRRLALNPQKPSLYGKLRREPRREALSTIEAAALTLARIERKPEIEKALGGFFGTMLDKYRAALKEGLVGAPASSVKRRPPRRDKKPKSAPPAAGFLEHSAGQQRVEAEGHSEAGGVGEKIPARENPPQQPGADRRQAEHVERRRMAEFRHLDQSADQNGDEQDLSLRARA